MRRAPRSREHYRSWSRSPAPGRTPISTHLHVGFSHHWHHWSLKQNRSLKQILNRTAVIAHSLKMFLANRQLLGRHCRRWSEIRWVHREVVRDHRSTRRRCGIIDRRRPSQSRGGGAGSSESLYGMGKECWHKMGPGDNWGVV